MKIGILAFQGAFLEHQKILSLLNISSILIKDSTQLNEIDGLIIPGGESTAIRTISQRNTIWLEIKQRLQQGLPAFGTCAGAILLAREIIGEKMDTFAMIDVSVKRNDYGRQVDSFETELQLMFSPEVPFKAIFIRAPGFENLGRKVETLTTHDNKPVLLKEKHILIAAFHPELTSDTRVHKYFIDMIKD